MSIKRYYLSIVLIGLQLLFIGHALASDVSSAEYKTTISISNTGTAVTNQVAVFDLDTDIMISSDMLGASADDCAMQTSAGSDIVFMPSVNFTYPWCTWVSSIGESSSIYQYLYSKGASGGDIRYFPGSTGMTVDDDATLELSDNGSISFTDTWIDTSQTDTRFVTKPAAFDVKVGSVAENVTATIYDSPAWTNIYEGDTTGAWETQSFSARWVTQIRYRAQGNGSGSHTLYEIQLYDVDSASWVSPTSGSGTNWNNTANATDGDTGTYASEPFNHGSPTWDNYFTCTFTSGPYWSNSVRVWYGESTENNQVDLYDSDVALSVTATVASGEHDLDVAIDSPFFSLGIDATSSITPVSDNLVMNLPLWQTDFNTANFTSIDDYEHSCASTNTTWSSSGLSFNGVSSWVDCGEDAAIEPTAEISLEAWVTADKVSGYQDIASSQFGGTNGYYLELVNQNISFGYSPLSPLTTTTTNPMSTATPTHIMATYNGTTVVIYVNGTAIKTGTPTGTPVASTKHLFLGRYANTLAQLLDGTIHEFRVYNKALSPSEVLQNYNVTKSKYTSGDIYVISTLGTVPDNANDWTLGDDEATPYIGTMTITKDGVTAGEWGWEYSTTFTDGSGNGNTGTPSFRTTSSDADVSTSPAGFISTFEASTPTGNTTGGWSMIESVPDAPSSLWSEGGSDFPLGPEITAVADAAGQPQTVWLFAFAFALAAGAFILTYAATHKMKIGIKGSLILSCLAAELVLIFFTLTETVPGFALIPLGLILIGLTLWRKSAAPVD